MSLAEYTIKIDSGDFGISIDPGNTQPGSQLVISKYSEQTRLQRWQFLYDPSTQGAIIYNPYFNVCIAPDGDRIVTYPYKAQDESAGKEWQICGSRSSVIRMWTNHDLNMNAAGGGTRGDEKLIVYPWKGPKSNMLWTSKVMSDPAAS